MTQKDHYLLSFIDIVLDIVFDHTPFSFLDEYLGYIKVSVEDHHERIEMRPLLPLIETHTVIPSQVSVSQQEPAC